MTTTASRRSVPGRGPTPAPTTVAAPTPAPAGARPGRARTVVVTIAALSCIAAAVIVIGSAVSTSSARIAATTSSDGLLGAATIALTQPDSAVELLLDGDGLFPGVAVEGCAVVEYTGTVPVALRLHGSRSASSSLDEYVDIELRRLDADTCPTPVSGTAPVTSGTEVFSGRLSTLWQRHGSYGRGVDLARTAESGDRIVVAATASVVDDNRAQGRTTDFTITIEARPT